MKEKQLNQVHEEVEMKETEMVVGMGTSTLWVMGRNSVVRCILLDVVVFDMNMYRTE
jgi:hypothetical protein